jgi:precorrin-6B methylase 2
MAKRTDEPRPAPPASGGTDLDEAVDQLGEAEKRATRVVERRILLAGPAAVPRLLERFAAARSPLRDRLCRVIGRLARAPGGEGLREFLLGRLADDDGKTRRNAIIALGRFPPSASPGLEARLLEALDRETDPRVRRSLLEALGKVGGPSALAAIDALEGVDPAAGPVVAEARARLARTLGRDAPSRIRGDARPPRPAAALLHCRAGLERVLLDELPAAWRPRLAGPGRVAVTVDFPLAELWRARVMLRFGLPLPPVPLAEGDDPGDAVVAALAAPAALRLLRALTDGAIRYRIEWIGRGHQRAATRRCAAALARACPELVNDPIESPWEVQVRHARGRLLVELWPKGLEDPRFAYRVRTAPASSHPTVAAALARLAIGEALPGAVVWDPFVGTATELIELSLLGHPGPLLGSDLDAGALEAARENLRAAGVEGVELALGDARSHRPPRPVDLIVTNPPLGRRIPIDDLQEFLADVLRHAARVLVPGGRLVWVSPDGPRTAALAPALGLELVDRRAVDMGGFSAEAQVLARAGTARNR